MGIKFQIANNELLCLYTPDFNYKDVLKRINEYGCNIKNTFYVTKKDLLGVYEDKLYEDELYEEPICFSIGQKKGEYIHLNKNIFGVENNFYFLSSINFEQKLFTAYQNISIIKKIDNLIDYDFYVGLENNHAIEISYDLYLELIKKFPNSTELKYCFQFMISSLCYNFYHLFRILVLEGKDQKIRMNTFRNKYQKIAVKVVRHARRIILSFSSAYRYKKKFLKYYQKLQN